MAVIITSLFLPFWIVGTSYAFISPASITSNPSIPSINLLQLQAQKGSTSTFFSPTRTSNKNNDNNAIEDETFNPPNPKEDFDISDPDCIAAASKMRRILVPVPTSVSSSGEVGLSYIHWPADATAAKKTKKDLLPILLIHGFDSSSLEYRRLGPQLSSRGVDVYAIDLLGWGYTQLSPSDSNKDSSPTINYSATSKIQAVASFWKTIQNNKPVAVCGASLGGAAAIEVSTLEDTPVEALVLIDAQGFIDGIGPVVSILPKPLAKLGIGVLKSNWLRNSANQMSYFDKETFATDDAVKVGRMHCLTEGWEDSMLNFMTSGGFKPKTKVPLIEQETCVIWGRNDEILDGDEFANKFMETLPNKSNQLNWIEECGHVPHLEQPDQTALVIYNFLNGINSSTSGEDGTTADNASTKLVGVVGGVAATAAILAAASSSFGN